MNKKKCKIQSRIIRNWNTCWSIFSSCALNRPILRSKESKKKLCENTARFFEKHISISAFMQRRNKITRVHLHAWTSIFKVLISFMRNLNATKRKKLCFKRRWSAWMETNWVCRKIRKTNGQEMLLIVYVPDRKPLRVCLFTSEWTLKCVFKHCTLSIRPETARGSFFSLNHRPESVGRCKKGRETLKTALIMTKSLVVLIKVFEKIFL